MSSLFKKGSPVICSIMAQLWKKGKYNKFNLRNVLVTKKFQMKKLKKQCSSIAELAK